MIHEQLKLARRVDDLKGTAVGMSSGVFTAFVSLQVPDGYYFVMLGLALAACGAIGTIYLIIMIQRQLIQMMVLPDPIRAAKARMEIESIGDDDIDW